MWELLVRVDKFLNYLAGGERDQTISARAGFYALQGSRAACKLCKILDKIDQDHCLKEVLKWVKH